MLRSETARHTTETYRAEIAWGVVVRGCLGGGKESREKRVGREVAEKDNGSRPVSEGGLIVCRPFVCLGQTACFLRFVMG